MFRTATFLSLILCCAIASIANADVSLTVEAGEFDRVNSLVLTDVPAECQSWDSIAAKFAGGVLPCQIVGAKSEQPQLAILIKSLPKGARAKLQLHESTDSHSASSSDSEAKIVDKDGKLIAQVAGKTVLAYHQAIVESPDNLAEHYRRSGHIHPLLSPAGKMVTDDFAPDHAHQHGVMFAWTKCSFEGREVNFWEQRLEQAIVRHAKTLWADSGPVLGEFRVQILHRDKTSGSLKDVLLDTWTVRVHNIESYYVFDLHSSHQCVADSPLTIQQYHYGGMAIRGARSWTKDSDIKFTTNEKKSREEANHSRPEWCDIRGSLHGARAGVTLLGHPENFRAAQPVRIHPTMPYFCSAPLVLGEFKIDPQQKFESRYRFVISDGEIDPKKTNAIWQDYAHPIHVKHGN